MDAKTGRSKFGRKQGIYIASKYLPVRYLFIIKDKTKIKIATFRSHLFHQGRERHHVSPDKCPECTYTAFCPKRTASI